MFNVLETKMEILFLVSMVDVLHHLINVDLYMDAQITLLDAVMDLVNNPNYFVLPMYSNVLLIKAICVL